MLTNTGSLPAAEQIIGMKHIIAILIKKKRSRRYIFFPPSECSSFCHVNVLQPPRSALNMKIKYILFKIQIDIKARRGFKLETLCKHIA
jgi:hypothetical protein